MADVTESEETAEREPGPMESAVLADMERWGPKMARTTLAVGALDMAQRLDEGGMRPTAASLLHAQLRASVLELEKLAPPQADVDDVDELKGRRARRRGA